VIDKAQKLCDRLEAGRQTFLDTLHSLTPEQQARHPSPQGWSGLEVLEHVVLVEQAGMDTLSRLNGRASSRRSLRYQIGYALVWLVLTTGLRVKVPIDAVRPSGSKSLEESERLWKAVRGRLDQFLAGLDEEGLRRAAYKHPIAGPLNVEEGLLFLIRHLAHHQRQLERIRKQVVVQAA
jgi:uncharacterized damage-inducible protein DinB